MTYDSDSRASSPLSSVPSTSPSPPPELRSLVFSNGYPSPSSSKRSSAETSPVPENMSLTPASGDDSPPRKKRKLAEPKPRTTEYLDLRFGEVAASEQAQLDRLLKVLHKKKKIVVIAGAGISVSAGSAFPLARLFSLYSANFSSSRFPIVHRSVQIIAQ